MMTEDPSTPVLKQVPSARTLQQLIVVEQDASVSTVENIANPEETGNFITSHSMIIVIFELL